MTITIVRLARLAFPDGFAYADITFDSPGIDPTSESGGLLFEGPVTSIEVGNTSQIKAAAVHFEHSKGQGGVIFSRTIEPDTIFTFTPSGPLNNLEAQEIPRFSLGDA